MLELIWHDGKLTTGQTWTDLERSVRAMQWSPYKSKREFRKDLRRRAYVWSGRRVHASGTSRQFLEQLAQCGMFYITHSGGGKHGKQK